MKYSDHLLLWTIGGTLFVIFLIFVTAVVLALSVFFIPEKHTYTPDEIGQVIHSPIPHDATDIQYSSEMHRGYFIKLSFKAPPTSTDQFAANICQGILYEGYDPFSASNSYAARPSDVILKANGYAYFSSSIGATKSVYGNRCSIENQWVQIKIDKRNSGYYTVRFETLSYTCDVDVMCSAPYGFDNTSYRPLPKNSPLPLEIYGFENTKNEHILKGKQVCVETKPDSFSHWDEPPFDLKNLKGSSFELFVDDTSKGQAIISHNGRLQVDYSTGQFIGLHEPPEYCFQVDSSAGTHQMSIEVKTPAGQHYQYSWDFRKE